jgi:hypothetical protein
MVELKGYAERRPVRVPPEAPGRAFPRLRLERREYSSSERQCVAEMMAKLRCGEDVRAERVYTMRDGIDVDNETTIDVVVDRLLNELSD